MGASGTSLYADDSACDVRGGYIDKLRRGKSNQEATEELLEANRDLIGDSEEEPIFWFALADTQWNYGRLLPEVKEKALYFLSQTGDLDRWRDVDEKRFRAWKDTRQKLKEKLLSPVPPEKKVSAYRLYRCKWQLGDVFAYQFCSEYSSQKGFFEKYIVFRKVTEDYWWPGHIIPTVEIYQWIGNKIPSLEQISGIKLLPQGFHPVAYVNYPHLEKKHLFNLVTTRESQIPKAQLTFLGNLQSEDLHALEHQCGCGYNGAQWKDFEKVILNQYLAWSTMK